MNTIIGYEFAITDNAPHLPSASGTQNEGTAAAAVRDPEPEDAILVASGLLPRLIKRAREDPIEELGRLLNGLPVTDEVWDRIVEEPYG